MPVARRSSKTLLSGAVFLLNSDFPDVLARCDWEREGVPFCFVLPSCELLCEDSLLGAIPSNYCFSNYCPFSGEPPGQPLRTVCKGQASSKKPSPRADLIELLDVCSSLFWVPAQNSLAWEVLSDSGMASSLCSLAQRDCLQNQVSHSYRSNYPGPSWGPSLKRWLQMQLPEPLLPVPALPPWWPGRTPPTPAACVSWNLFRAHL